MSAGHTREAARVKGKPVIVRDTCGIIMEFVRAMKMA
jgi:hypothetical protein